MNWILILWIWTGSFGFPSYFGRYESKEQCEAIEEALEIRMPGNGITIANYMCLNSDDPKDRK